MGRASRRKKDKLLQIPAKPARPKPQGFAPVEDDLDFYFPDDDDFLDELDGSEIQYPFMNLIKEPENPTLNLPDNELYAACVCDGEMERQPVWLCVFHGSLDECLQGFRTVILMNYDEQLRGLGLEPKEWEAKHIENFERIKQQCLEQGEAKAEGVWYIASKKNHPSFFRDYSNLSS